MTERPDDPPRRASDRRFRRHRAELADALRGLLGTRAGIEPLADADGAAALAAEARAGQRAVAEHAWAVVRHAWPTDDRTGVTAVVHATAALLGSRACWLIVPGREPQAVAVESGTVLDNPLGFAALAEDFELLVVDQQLPAGLWVGRVAHSPPEPAAYGWELEVWGAEPWLSAATRALREWRAAPPAG